MTEVALLAENIRSVREAVAGARSAGARVALVPTMGALHAGHLALVRRAGEVADFTVVSIFVNPLQFGPNEDLDRYPRTLREDLDRLGELGVPVVFAPAVTELYPSGSPQTRLSAGDIGTRFEGATRPGHFDGVLTVVSKLLNIVQPDTVLFGQKDAQQVFLVRRMIADLNVPVRVEVVPTVREEGGLALSSRNRYLSGDQRQAARTLSASLAAASGAAPRGLSAALDAAHAVLRGEPEVRLDYFEIVDPATFLPLSGQYRGEGLAVLAAGVGTTRLIDNAALTLG